MTTTPADVQTMRGSPAQPWEERFGRYAHNAAITAGYSDSYASRQRRAACMHSNAAANARSHGDTEGARLYDDMAEAALDAADALADLAILARQVAAHYARLIPATETGQEK